MDVIANILTTYAPVIWQGLEWFFVTIIIKYIVVRWIADIVLTNIKRVLIKTRTHAIYWFHYRERAAGHGHKYDTPELCQDGACKSLTDPNVQVAIV